MAHNEILQIVVFSIFLGCSLTAIGEKGSAIVHALDSLAHAMLKLTGTSCSSLPDRIRCYFSIDC